jgi:hypothetical protein
MSFGFGVGDFLAVGQLAMKLFNACAAAPSEFQELRRDLSSIHTALYGLQSQAEDPTSLLRQRYGDRKPEWITLRQNLEATLLELEDLVNRYQQMGRNAWLRVQLGLKNLSDLRGKLSLHLNAINGFIGSLTLSSLGRMEPALGRIESLLLEFCKEERLGHKAPTVLSAHEAGDGPAWKQMKLDLLLGGISKEDLERNEDRIKELLDWVVNNERDLVALQDVEVGDSISQQGSSDDEFIAPDSTLVDSLPASVPKLELELRSKGKDPILATDSTTGQYPQPYIARQCGDSTFERFDHLSVASLGSRKIGKAKVDCRILLSKLRCGVIGEKQTPAAILYMDLNFDQPKDCTLASATILMTLMEETVDDRNPSLRFTDLYGPRYIGGEPKSMTVPKTLYNSKVDILGNSVGGIGMDREKSITYTSCWTFTGQLLHGTDKHGSGARRTDYRALKWEFTESKLGSQLNCNPIHVGFAIEHEGKPFYLRVEIQGKLQNTTDRIRHLLKFPPNHKTNESSTLTLIQLPQKPLKGDLRRLDEVATGLASYMEMENMLNIPLEIPN